MKASGDVAIWSLFESLQGPAPTRSSRSPAHHPPNSKVPTRPLIPDGKFPALKLCDPIYHKCPEHDYGIRSIGFLFTRALLVECQKVAGKDGDSFKAVRPPSSRINSD